jgi:cyclopropane-fatty-acyl-phospholipid synthase
MTDIIKQLAEHDIHRYGSEPLLKFEKQMERFFKREYERWHGNNNPVEDYGVSSFKGEIAKKETRNVSVDHYNEDYQLYLAFLDNVYMAYSMAYYGATTESPKISDISLEQAQINKYKLLAERADIQDGQTILDFGCGFGGLPKFLLNTYPNVKVVGINPSKVQTNHIKNVLIAKDESFDDSRFELLTVFFDDVDADMIKDNYFDRVISVGVLEHVTNIDLLQKNISRLLKPGGKCLHHCIVSSDTIPNFLNSEASLMGHYYPGAHILPFSEIKRHTRHIEYSDSWFVNGLNYWKTLDEWHQRFWQAIEQLYPKHISLQEVEDWNKYFSLCKTMFSPNHGNSYGNGQYLFIKK